MIAMLKSKTIDRICCIALAVMIALTAVIWIGKASVSATDGEWETSEVGYESLFDQSVIHTIDIEISDWDNFIASAGQEEYVECNVVIDGERLNNVAIRAKGNTSLSSVSGMGSQKYSFKIEFDHLVKGRLYKGLDKLSLNNLIYDATMMKDYLAYTLMGKMGVPAPLCSFAQIRVNGEDWGLYLAVEGVENGFRDRNNMTRGELYKPDSMNFGGGRGNGRDFDFEDFRVDGDDETSAQSGSSSDGASAAQPSFDSFGGFSFPGGMPAQGGDFSGFGDPFSGGMSPPDGNGNGTDGFSGMTPPSGESGMTFPEGFSDRVRPSEGFGAAGEGNTFTFNMPNFNGNFNFGTGNSDVKLVYTDDDPDSYPNIFDNAKTEVKSEDQARLIEALRKLNAEEDIDETVYTDEVIRYLAVHDFLQNSDSYTGMMVHNYYLYEENGKLAIIPWDYNLAFGGMSATDGTSLVNSPIDTPVTSGSVSDRPLIAWIFEDEDYLNRYHTIYGQFVSKYIESGWLDAEITRVSELIRPYVEKDRNSFFSVEEFDTAVAELKEYCSLRGQSIRLQLDGQIPSTSSAQRASNSALIDGSGLDVTAMGSMGSGGGFGSDRGGFSGMAPSGSRDKDKASSDPENGSDGAKAPTGEEDSNAFGGRTMPPGSNGSFPDGENFNGFPEASDGGNIPQGFPGGAALDGFSGSFGSGNIPQGFPGGTASDGFSGAFGSGNIPQGFPSGFTDDYMTGSFSGFTSDAEAENPTGSFPGGGPILDSADATPGSANAGDLQKEDRTGPSRDSGNGRADGTEFSGRAAGQALPSSSESPSGERSFSRDEKQSDRKKSSDSSEDEGATPISTDTWIQLGLCTLVILLAVFVVMKLPRHNR